MTATGAITPTGDPEVRAAFFLVNDLALVLLRNQLATVLGVDPLAPEGITRWEAEVTTIYTDGAFRRPPSAVRRTISTPGGWRAPGTSRDGVAR